MKYYLKVLQNYAVFTGRARRSEYWFFALFNAVFLIVASLLDNLLGITFKTYYLYGGGEFRSSGYGYIYLIYSLAVLIPGLAVLVRRLHDNRMDMDISASFYR